MRISELTWRLVRLHPVIAIKCFLLRNLTFFRFQYRYTTQSALHTQAQNSHICIWLKVRVSTVQKCILALTSTHFGHKNGIIRTNCMILVNPGNTDFTEIFQRVLHRFRNQYLKSQRRCAKQGQKKTKPLHKPRLRLECRNSIFAFCTSATTSHAGVLIQAWTLSEKALPSINVDVTSLQTETKNTSHVFKHKEKKSSCSLVGQERARRSWCEPRLPQTRFNLLQCPEIYDQDDRQGVAMWGWKWIVTV